MADASTTGFTVISPEDAAKLYTAKKAPTSSAGYKVISADEAARLMKSKPVSTPQQQSWGETAKEAGQNVAVQSAGMAPIIAGAEGGAMLGAAGGPFAEVTVPIGAMAGAGLGAMTSPTARYYMGKLVGSKQPEPTVKEANYEGTVGAATEGMSGPASVISGGIVNPIFDSLVGKSELGDVGSTAARATEESNATEKAKLQDAATKEATKQKTATAQAAEKQGQTNLAERADAAKKAADKQASFSRAHEDAKAKADSDFQAKSAKLTEQYVPEARQETVVSAIGKTPEQTRVSRFDPNFAQNEAAKREILLKKSNEAGDEFHQEYETTLGPYNDKPIALTNTAAKAAELEAAAEKNNWKLSPSTRALLNESKGMAAPPPEKVTGFANMKPSVSGARQAREALGISEQDWGKMSKTDQDFAIANARGKAAPAGKPQPVGTTVAQARGLNSKWGAQAGDAESYDGLVAKQMRESLLTDLDGSGVPRIKELNNRYRAFRNGGLGDYDFLGKVSQPKGGELHNVAGEIFNNPQRGTDFIKRLSPEEKAQFRDMYADYINTGGKINPDHAPILQQLGFKGPLTKPEAWVYADKQAKNLDEIFASNPNAKHKLDVQIEAAREEALNNLDSEIIKQGYKDANALGTTGARIKLKMDAAKTPAEKASIAVQEFNNLDPGQAAADAAKGQQKPGMAGYQQGVMPAPRDARQAAQGFQPQDPQAAAAQAIQQFSPSHGRWASYLLRHAAYSSIAGGIMGATRGSIPPMLVGAAASAGTVLGRDLVSAWWRSAIQESPEAAAVFYRGLQNPGTPAALHTFAQSAVNAGITNYITQHGGSPMPEPTPSKGPGPMVKQVEHEKAVNIAGPRGAVSPARTSRIEDLNKDIAEGKEPEVHADLRNGRLTHTDIAKMVQPDKGGVAALFQGMSPTQAVDAFAVADPSERELGLSALAQHLQDSAKTTDPKQMAIAMQKLKSIMAQQGATA